VSFQKKEYKPLELKAGDGMLFESKNPTSEKSPHYMGEIEIPEGMTGRVKISLWKKKSKAGNTYLSVSLWQPNGERSARPAPKKPAPQRNDDPEFDDEIPF
jgi:uncharacterized protein (DUF736 family)